MELGNLIFGCSRGDIETPGEIDTLLRYLIIKIIGEEDGYGIEYVNDIFELHKYYWGDCTCGYENKVIQWEKDNKHSETCYQTALKNICIEKNFYDKNGEYITSFSKSFIDYRNKEMRKIYEQLCIQFGLTYPEGCAVHCTCDYKTKHQEFLKNENHKSSCLIIKPNFWYKPTDFKIMWYKYIGRDSYMNKFIDTDDFVNIIDKCVESVKKG